MKDGGLGAVKMSMKSKDEEVSYTFGSSLSETVCNYSFKYHNKYE